MPKGEKPMKSLANASYEELCKLKRDHYGRSNFSIMTDSTTVWLSEQAVGEDRSQQFECSHKMFNFLIAQYQKPRKPVRGKSK